MKIGNWKLKIKRKPTILVLGIILALAITGTVLGINGFFGGGGSIPSDTMTRGLVGYWGFDEGRATTTNDSSGNNNTGYFATAASSPAWTQGKVGNGSALSFDGTDDYVGIPTINIPTDIAVEAWVYSTNYNQNGFIVQKAPVNAQWQLFFEAAALKWRGGDTTTVSCTLPADSQWHYVAATQKGTAAIIYIDGKQCGSGAATAIGNGAGLIDIGRHSASGYFFNGLIDEVRVYNRALSAEEIRYHYNRGGPVAQWKFDEGSGLTAYDSSGNANTGTLQNNMATTSWTSGKYGSALSFDGVNDYVDAGTGASLNTTGSLTLSAWVKMNAFGVIGGEYHFAQVVNKHFISGNQRSYILDLYNTNSISKIRLGISTDGINEVLHGGDTTLSTGVWYFVTAVYNSSVPSMDVYLNGVKDAATKTAGVPSSIYSSSAPVRIGKMGDELYYQDGPIDDVRVYNYARTPDEIRLDYNAGFAAKFGGSANCDVNPGTCVTKGLVGYWGMDEGRGTTTSDISGNNNTGVFATAASSPAWTSGKVGGALSFNGTTTYVDAGTGASLNITNAITVEVWVKKSGGDGTYMAIGSKWDSAGGDGNQRSWTLEFRATDNKVQFQTSNNGLDSGAVQAISTTVPVISTWYHIVGIFDGSNNKIYVNGILENTTAQTGLFSSVDKVGIGAVIGTGLAIASKFNGLIDEVRIYNRALSAEEIRYHYNRGGPIGYWKFDKGSGLTAYDSSGQGNTGTLQNNMATTSWTSGKYGSALSFDGVDDYVSVPTSSTTEITSAITVSAWVKPESAMIANEIVQKNGAYGLKITNNNKFIGYRWGSPENHTSITTAVPGNWYFVVMTFDSLTHKIYVNGVLENSESDANAIPSSANNLAIGAQTGGGGKNINGLIDDVRIYNYARTTDEIRLDYNAGFAAKFGTSADCNLNPGACMTKGLVGYWGMDEGRATTTNDSSGNNNTGYFATAASSPAWTSGNPSKISGQASGGALSFDGTNDYVIVADSNSLDITDAVTISAWVKPISWPIDLMRVVYKQSYSMHWRNNNTYGGFFWWSDDTSDYFDSTTQLALGNWYHIAITYDKTTGKLLLYLNGSLDKTFSGYTKSMKVLTNNLGIGAGDDASRFSNAIIDEVRVYNRALTAEEIRYHYNRGGPIGYWKFDEGSATTTFDSSGNNNTGYLQNNMATTSWTSGKYGSALLFDGVNDFVNMGDVIEGLSAYSVSAWIKLASLPGTDAHYRIVGKNNIFGFSIFNSGFPRIHFNNGNGGSWSSRYTLGATQLSTGTWYFVTATLNGTDTRVYVDGKLDDVKTSDYSGIGSAVNNMTIGAMDGAQFFNGLIDDVRVYNYARTPEQILQDYNQGKSIQFR